MKRIVILVIIIIIISSCTHREPCQYIYDSSENVLIKTKTMIEYLKNADIVFFGEIHDDSLTHVLQLDIYKQLLGNGNIALGLEMFERDVQHILELYIADSITESVFLDNSRPWNNYNDYRSLVETAKARNVPVIALNIPRHIASAVASGGMGVLENFPPEYYTVFESHSQQYKDAFINTMEELGQNAPMNKMINKDNLFFAQVIKDATMAQSIIDFIEKGNMKIFILNGEFHSNYHLGIIEQLRLMGYEGNIVTIAVIDSLCGIDNEIADFLYIKELYEQ